jgi:DNA-binding transcriptional ArsR family regulator
LSDLIDAMIIHICHLVHDEQKPFSYLDFMKFEVDGLEFKMTHGTFRNNVSSLMKEGLVEVSFKSNITFYTLRGVRIGKARRIAMTGDHMVVTTPHTTQQLSSNPVYRIIKDLPLEKNSVHDIRLKFHVPDIYRVVFSQLTSSLLHD